MYYISDIITDSGRKLNSVTYWPYNSIPHFEVELTDFQTDEKRMASSHEIADLACIGYGNISGVVRDLYHSVPSEVLVKHTLKTATLHKYVLEVRSLVGTELADSGEIDAFIYGNMISQNGNCKIAGVDTSGETYFSCNGVMIHRRGFDGIRFTKTLYDVLGEFCRECNRNLMSYELIAIYSRVHNVTTVVRLAQTDEAKRFFTKMFLDVMLK